VVECLQAIPSETMDQHLSRISHNFNEDAEVRRMVRERVPETFGSPIFVLLEHALSARSFPRRPFLGDDELLVAASFDCPE